MAAVDAGGLTPAADKPADMRVVIAASAAGTAFEWYDFFVFVPLAGVIARNFSAGLDDAAALVFALGSFAVGFAFRPVGALIFGRIGDRTGRKGAFLITVSLMGAATFLIGCLPTFAQIGVASPLLFLVLRMLQGIALGGEYGGAAIYVAEHAPPARRGLFTSFIQTSAAIGLCAALLVTLATRSLAGEAAFNAWAWRVPFLASAGLLAVSIWIRLKLTESPSFKALAAEGNVSKAPYAEAFGQWPNLKRVLIALFALMVAQGSVWYCAFFYAQVFIERVVHVAPATVNAVMIAVVIASAPLYVFFGWLSDKVGRKWVTTLGTLLATAALFPGFHLMTELGNPRLVAATRAAPVTVAADPKACAVQFDPVGRAQYRSSCDVAKATLSALGVSYVNAPLAAGRPAEVRVGDRVVVAPEGAGLDKASFAAVKKAAADRIAAALRDSGYPTGVAEGTNAVGLFLVLLVFTIGATALYGPQAATLVELFPTRVRYTALSLPYHLGTGWVGGFLPATAYAMVVASGNIHFGLWYPVVGGVIAVLAAVFFLPETRGTDLDA